MSVLKMLECLLRSATGGPLHETYPHIADWCLVIWVRVCERPLSEVSSSKTGIGADVPGGLLVSSLWDFRYVPRLADLRSLRRLRAQQGHGACSSRTKSGPVWMSGRR